MAHASSLAPASPIEPPTARAGASLEACPTSEPLRLPDFPTIGLLYYSDPNEEILAGHQRSLDHLGCRVVPFRSDAAIPDGLDGIFVVGPYASLTPLIYQLAALPPHKRPRLGYLLTEQLPNPRLPEGIRRGLGSARVAIERLLYRASHVARRTSHLSTGFAHRYRYYGELFWMQKLGLLDGLAVWSYWTADALRRQGFSVVIPARGCNPAWGAELHLERDIPVLWLGKTGTRRRGRLLARVRQELKTRGVDLLVIDGVERPYVFGQERTRLLNRTRIVLNLLREPWDDNSLRFGLATANRAMIVSEPMLPHSPYRPGMHLVEAPVAELADTICRYLADEPARARIAGQAFELISSVPPGQSMRDILAAMFAKRSGQ